MLIFSRLKEAFWGASDEIGGKPRMTFLESAITAGVGVYAFGTIVGPHLPMSVPAVSSVPVFSR